MTLRPRESYYMLIFGKQPPAPPERSASRGTAATQHFSMLFVRVRCGRPSTLPSRTRRSPPGVSSTHRLLATTKRVAQPSSTRSSRVCSTLLVQIRRLSQLQRRALSSLSGPACAERTSRTCLEHTKWHKPLTGKRTGLISYRYFSVPTFARSSTLPETTSVFSGCQARPGQQSRPPSQCLTQSTDKHQHLRLRLILSSSRRTTYSTGCIHRLHRLA